MAEEEDDDTWILDLEAALLDTCSATSIHAISKGKAFPETIRPEAWAACLEIRDKEDQLIRFNEIYDLAEQEELRSDCQNAVEKLGNDEYDKVSVVSDIESILTYYCKCKNVKYDKREGFVELLLPILALKRPKSETYNVFEAVVDQYVLKNSTEEASSLFRLLILYHDPELCSFLDTKRVTPDLYAVRWFKTLFSSTCCLKVVQAIWDFYFQQNDPFFVFFLALVIVVNGKEHIVSLKDQDKNKIVEMISVMPAALERDDVADFCSLARYYVLKTPDSFKKDSFRSLFGPKSDRPEPCELSQALCLPVSASELVENATETDSSELRDDPLERVRFFLVDCRPADQYNAGHLPTAFHLDCNLMLQEPSSFNVAVQGLLSAQKQSIAANSNAGGEHLCFLGSGRDEEDRYAHMVVASFLQKHTQYISILTGGYQAVHDYFGTDLSDCLEDHDAGKCLVCNVDGPRISDESSSDPAGGNSTSDLFGKISAAVKTKSRDFKEKLIEYIVDPTTGTENERHVSPADKVGKLYRNLAPVFSIDDENLPDDLYRGDEDEEDPTRDVVPLSEYLKSDETVGYFKCKEVKENGYMYDSYLLVTDSHMIVLRELSHKKGYALLVVKRSLGTIVKITSKKKYQNLITFKYGNPDGDGTVISDMDRFFIQKATEATKLISQQILKSVEAKENLS